MNVFNIVIFSIIIIITNGNWDDTEWQFPLQKYRQNNKNKYT